MGPRMYISNKFPDAAADSQPTLWEPLLLRTSIFCFCYNKNYTLKKDTYGLLNVGISGGLLELGYTETKYSHLPTNGKTESSWGLPVVSSGEALNYYQIAWEAVTRWRAKHRTSQGTQPPEFYNFQKLFFTNSIKQRVDYFGNYIYRVCTCP